MGRGQEHVPVSPVTGTRHGGLREAGPSSFIVPRHETTNWCDRLPAASGSSRRTRNAAPTAARGSPACSASGPPSTAGSAASSTSRTPSPWRASRSTCCRSRSTRWRSSTSSGGIFGILSPSGDALFSLGMTGRYAVYGGASGRCAAIFHRRRAAHLCSTWPSCACTSPNVEHLFRAGARVPHLHDRRASSASSRRVFLGGHNLVGASARSSAARRAHLVRAPHGQSHITNQLWGSAIDDVRDGLPHRAWLTSARRRLRRFRVRELHAHRRGAASSRANLIAAAGLLSVITIAVSCCRWSAGRRRLATTAAKKKAARSRRSPRRCPIAARVARGPRRRTRSTCITTTILGGACRSTTTARFFEKLIPDGAQAVGCLGDDPEQGRKLPRGIRRLRHRDRRRTMASQVESLLKNPWASCAIARRSVCDRNARVFLDKHTGRFGSFDAYVAPRQRAGRCRTH